MPNFVILKTGRHGLSVHDNKDVSMSALFLKKGDIDLFCTSEKGRHKYSRHVASRILDPKRCNY